MMKIFYIFIALLIFADQTYAQGNGEVAPYYPGSSGGDLANKKVYVIYTQPHPEDGRKVMGTFIGKVPPSGTMPDRLYSRSAYKKGYYTSTKNLITTDKQVFKDRKKDLAEDVKKHNETLGWSNSPRTRDDQRVYVTTTEHNPETDQIRANSSSGFGNPQAIVTGNLGSPARDYHKDANNNYVEKFSNFTPPKLHSYTTDKKEFLKQKEDLQEKVESYNREHDAYR